MNRFIVLFLLCLHCSFVWADVNPIIFREYDIRGVVGEEFLIDDASDIASAIATYLKEQKPDLKVLSLGADGRVHSPAIKENVIATLKKYGFTIVDIGTCTTPVMYFSLHNLPVEAGIMITASHNPGQYNGFKICLGKNSVTGPEIKKIRAIYENKTFLETSSTQGDVQSYDLISDYINYFAVNFPHLIGSELKAIVDCGNGAAGTVMPKLVDKMQWKNVQLLYPEVDGTYPNHIADPSVEAYMDDLRSALASSDAEFGLGFDGDADRMAPMTKSGRLIKGDQLVTFYSYPILQSYPGSAIVFDISSSTFLHEMITKWGGKPYVSRTGVGSVKSKMAETGAYLGGEISCHTVFKDRYFGFDDGIYSMMRLFELITESAKSLDEWASILPATVSSPTYRLPCERSVCLEIVEELKSVFIEQPNVELITIDGLRVHFPNGWAIVRASGTEPLISMRFEGRTDGDLKELKQLFYPIISRYIECSALNS